MVQVSTTAKSYRRTAYLVENSTFVINPFGQTRKKVLSPYSIRETSLECRETTKETGWCDMVLQIAVQFFFQNKNPRRQKYGASYPDYLGTT
jgi:hypothetical protein